MATSRNNTLLIATIVIVVVLALLVLESEARRGPAKGSPKSRGPQSRGARPNKNNAKVMNKAKPRVVNNAARRQAGKPASAKTNPNKARRDATIAQARASRKSKTNARGRTEMAKLKADSMMRKQRARDEAGRMDPEALRQRVESHSIPKENIDIAAREGVTGRHSGSVNQVVDAVDEVLAE